MEDPLAHIPPAPRTPSARARALIFRYQGAQLALYIVGMVLIATGTPMSAFFCWGVPADLALSFSPRLTVGHVVDATVELHTRVNGGHPSEIRFRYLDGAGTEREAVCHAFDRAVIASALPGAEVPVERFGSWARIRGTWRSPFGLWTIPVLIDPLIGAILFLWAVRSRRRAVRAFTDGHPTLARVTYAGENRNVRVNGGHPLVVRWEFTVAGEPFHGSLSSMNRELLGDLLGQKELVVLYDQMNPSVNTAWVA